MKHSANIAAREYQKLDVENIPVETIISIKISQPTIQAKNILTLKNGKKIQIQK